MEAQDNKKLDKRQQSIVSIAALTATGDLEQLKYQLNAGLEAGLTVNETKEILVQLYAYCGFPRSLNGITTFMAVMEERKSRGIADREGKDATGSKSASGKYEQGRKVLETLTATPQARPAPGFGEFAPRIDGFLKEHLFADVFDSDVLTFQERELVTISALTAMTGVEGQLNAHIRMGINTGLTESQLEDLAAIIARNINETQANVLRKLIKRPVVPIIEPDMMVRISEIEVLPEHVEAYLSILKEEAAASVKVEPGVIAIFPMCQQENPTQIRIVEIYANKEAYQLHLQTPHFRYYKSATGKMVKSLALIDMNTIDRETMIAVFRKLN